MFSDTPGRRRSGAALPDLAGSLIVDLRKSLLLSLLLMLVLSCGAEAKPQETKPGCRYESRHHEEGAPVNTSEPCLRCHCLEGSLRCRLRVCQRLPEPAPPGCRLLAPAEHDCCPRIVCGPQTDEEEQILQRSKVTEQPHSRKDEGCLHEGVRYGPGSAMMGSRRCEYCYCISGARRCIRPKCLLPLPGCAPLYAPHSCCPVAYNCTRQAEFSTTLAAISGNGCRSGDRAYQEGEMVRDITWKAACDNCFCAMGAIRCVPLACAPPLQGCKPIVREGQCCPSTYNCSGTIQVKADQNYASYAFISKDYAKFRKETNFYPAIHDVGLPNVEGRGHRIVEEHLDAGSISPEVITEILATEPGQPALETETMNNEILRETTDYVKRTTSDQELLTFTITEASMSADDDPNENETVTSTFDLIIAGMASLAAAHLRDDTGTTLREISTEIPLVTDSISSHIPPGAEKPTTVTNPAIIAETEILNYGIIIPTSSPPNLNTSLIGKEKDVSSEEMTHPKTITSTTTVMNSTTSNGNKTKSSMSTISTTTTATTPSKNTTTTATSTEMTLLSLEKTTLLEAVKNSTSSSNVTPSTSSSPKSTSQSDIPAKDSRTTQASSSISTEKSTTSSPVTTTPSPATLVTTSTTKSDASEASAKEVEEVTLPIIPVKKPSGSLSTSIIVPDDTLVMDVDVKTNVAVDAVHGTVTIDPVIESKPSDFESLLNITDGEKDPDYEYDYNHPTLPPSLPNVRIIPFVAADALVEDKEDENGVPATVTGYPASAAAVPPPDLARADLNFHDIVTQPSRFNPPKKTEGGFVPKESSYFESAPSHSSNLNLEIGTGVTVAPQNIPMLNSQRRNDVLLNHCLYEEHEYIHGQVLPSRAACKVCLCYYGEIVCSDRKCPPMKAGCQRMKDPADECCDRIICGHSIESPTVVLDRVDEDPSQQHEPTVSPDPFRDVIKTEPAPDLPSLIGDLIMPHMGDRSASSPTSHAHGNPSSNRFDQNITPSNNDTFKFSDSEFSASEGANPGITDMHKFADNVTFTNKPDFDYIVKNDGENEDDSSVFSFGSVLDLFFNDSPSTEVTGTTPMISITTAATTATESTNRPSNLDSRQNTTSRENEEVSPIFRTTVDMATFSSPLTHTETDTTSTTTRGGSSTPRERDATTASPAFSQKSYNVLGGGLLKLAGCNIYGRMYQTGKIIAELSSPCLECRCTEIGVHCKQLNC